MIATQNSSASLYSILNYHKISSTPMRQLDFQEF